jgi:N-acetyl sugar amidotransferase
MPNTRPRVVFDDEGVCNACRNAETKPRIDWEARRKEFVEFIAPYRNRGAYDCIVPWSGGKDSSAIAYRLKTEFGLRPLLTTFSPLLPNELGVHNREALLRVGFDQVMTRPDQRISRHLAQRMFLERGNPKVHWDAGVAAYPLQVAVRYRIPLVVYAEHGPSEYGGRVLSEEHKKLQLMSEVLENQIGDDPSNWVDDVVGERDLAPYVMPELDSLNEVGVKAIYFSYFFRWSMLENYRYIADKFDFRTDPRGRTDGTFTDFDSLDDKIDNLYYHMQFIKFGFGRATRDSCRMIQNGQMSRAEALENARKYDDEYPKQFLTENLDYLGLDEVKFSEIVDKHRNSEIWKFEGNQWKLRYPPQ